MGIAQRVPLERSAVQRCARRNVPSASNDHGSISPSSLLCSWPVLGAARRVGRLLGTLCTPCGPTPTSIVSDGTARTTSVPSGGRRDDLRLPQRSRGEPHARLGADRHPKASGRTSRRWPAGRRGSRAGGCSSRSSVARTADSSATWASAPRTASRASSRSGTRSRPTSRVTGTRPRRSGRWSATRSTPSAPRSFARTRMRTTPRRSAWRRRSACT